MISVKNHWTIALTGVAQLVGHHPAKQKVTGSIPGRGAGPGCSGCLREAADLMLMFLTLSFSLPSPLSKKK